MGEIGPMAALSRHSRRRTSPMEKPLKGRLVVHPETATKNHFGLPPTENTVWPLVSRVRSVWYAAREREQKRLCFCSASRPLQSLESRDLTSSWGGRMSGQHQHPLPLPPRLPTQVRGAGQRWVWRCGVKQRPQLHHSPPRPPVPRL